MSGLPREVIKWLQSLDLTHPIRNVRRDFSNGYLLAEIVGWYYPQDIQMHSFSNGTSIQTKLGNWQQLERFFIKEQLDIAKDVIEGTIHCKPGAAFSLLERMYTLLTHKVLHYLPAKGCPTDFSDSSYQSQLPLHARSTTAQSIKNNLANTELTTKPDRTLSTQKAQAIMEAHVKQRKQDRENHPEHFGIRTSTNGKKTLPKANARDVDKQDETIKEIEVEQRLKPTMS
ncbi:spermatogenesis-associated protein 4-like [Halichondria panicea]|uniref:spermatogenesis-associated protein 4-like n=1 Tax=Halichondria panicea TaxID=6063 RepID=UPI00312BC02C